jgi:hypothetical protein
VGEKGRHQREENRGEGELELPKDLCAILENYRDLSIKHNFLINLKP